MTNAVTSAAIPPATGAAANATNAPTTPTTIAARRVAKEKEKKPSSFFIPAPQRRAVEVTATSARATATCVPSTSNSTNASSVGKSNHTVKGVFCFETGFSVSSFFAPRRTSPGDVVETPPR